MIFDEIPPLPRGVHQVPGPGRAMLAAVDRTGKTVAVARLATRDPAAFDHALLELLATLQWLDPPDD